MIKKEGDEYCVFSKDGTKKLGCFPSRKQAVKRLQQIEYFKHVKSGEAAMKVTDPVKDAKLEGKVPGTTVPNLGNTGHKKETYACVANMSEIQRKTYAGALIDRLKEQQDKLKEALKLAAKLMSDGLDGEEFSSLYDFTQSDILFQLLETGKANAKRTQAMAMVAKKARTAV